MRWNPGTLNDVRWVLTVGANPKSEVPIVTTHKITAQVYSKEFG